MMTMVSDLPHPFFLLVAVRVHQIVVQSVLGVRGEERTKPALMSEKHSRLNFTESSSYL